jgi:protein SCO1/2
MRLHIVAGLVMLALTAFAKADGSDWQTDLPIIRDAPDFTLVSQDGQTISLTGLSGKVVVVAFIYTWCPDICPMLTANMAKVQADLAGEFGKDIAFVSITFDPKRDTVEVLKEYADAFDADPAGWFFLTGDETDILDIARRYGVLTFPGVDDTIDHNLITTLVDRRGRMRVQYSGYSFEPEEMRRDIVALVAEQ